MKARAVLLFAALLLAFACESKVPEPPPPPKPVAQPKAPESIPSAAPAPAPAPSGSAGAGDATKVKIEDQKVGTGPAAKKGDKLSVHYTGKLADGTKFDSSRDRDEPFEVTLGEGGVIPGWEEGLLGMKKGGKRKLTIPSEKGYGKRGSPPKIPANATLVFEIELVEID